MNNIEKTVQNNGLGQKIAGVPQHILSAIKNASTRTGVSFTYLMEKAAAESSFNPSAKAKTSSATGLFQFIDSTWMHMVEKHGEKYGINLNQSKAQLLSLRKDAEISSCMAAEFAKDNQEYLQETVGGNISDTELYFAHFMGAKGASKFLNACRDNPSCTAAELFPKEARANKNVFFDPTTGKAKTMKEVYEFFDKKFSGNSGDYAAQDNVTTSLTRTNINKGYQHIPPSLKKQVDIITADHPSYNSILRLQSQMDDFFAKPLGNNEDALYGQAARHSSSLLGLWG